MHTCCNALQVCLELLIAIALRNRDRIVLIWPLVHEYLAAVMSPDAAKTANPLVSRVRPQLRMFSEPACHAQLAVASWTNVSWLRCGTQLRGGCSLRAPARTAGELPLLLLPMLQAALGLLRVCTRLLPYKYDVAEPLLKSMQLVLRLNSNVAWELAQQIAAEVNHSYCWCLSRRPRTACTVALHVLSLHLCSCCKLPA